MRIMADHGDGQHTELTHIDRIRVRPARVISADPAYPCHATHHISWRQLDRSEQFVEGRCSAYGSKLSRGVYLI